MTSRCRTALVGSFALLACSAPPPAPPRAEAPQPDTRERAPEGPPSRTGWRHDPTAALASRAQAWLDGNDCALSCHTTLPFMLAAEHLGPQAVAVRGAVVNAVAARVHAWPPPPWYAMNAAKVAQSRGSEAVLNAVALRGGEPADAAAALDDLFATQRRDGAWDWLDFSLAPWEDDTATTAGAALAAIAIADAPPASDARASAWQAGTEALRGYLAARVQDATSAHDHLMLLWAAARLDGIADAAAVARLTAGVLRLQRADGGWSLPALGAWQRSSGRPNRARTSDAYATALAGLVLAQQPDPEAQAAAARAREWLVAQQRADGTWAGFSLNDDDRFNAGLASDHATAFAVLALAAVPALDGGAQSRD